MHARVKGRILEKNHVGDEYDEMLRRSEEGLEEEDIGLLCSGKIFRLSGVKRTATNREGECSSTEGSDYGSVLLEESEFWET